MADISKTGFYGFPSHPSDGRVKIGHHGPGFPMKNLSGSAIEEKLKEVRDQVEVEYRKFIHESLPDLIDAHVIFSRLCIYCDTFDGNFLITEDPFFSSLYIAAGGSGHGFKFGPVLGELIADVVENKPNKFRKKKFQWRQKSSEIKKEAARFSTEAKM